VLVAFEPFQELQQILHSHIRNHMVSWFCPDLAILIPNYDTCCFAIFYVDVFHCVASITDRHLFEGFDQAIAQYLHTTLKMKQSLRALGNTQGCCGRVVLFPRHPPENKASVANLETFSAAGHSPVHTP